MSRPGRRRRPQNPPAPEKNPGAGALPFVVLSVLTSFGFIFYGMSVLTGAEAPRWLQVFAYATAGYGVFNVAVLSCAFAARAPWCITASQAIAVCYLGVYVMDTLAAGLESGLELLGVVLVGLVLWCNWMAVVKVVKSGGGK